MNSTAEPIAASNETQIAVWNAQLVESEPAKILQWAHEQWGSGVTLACSFGGVSGMALLDMAARAKLDIPVFYLDTEFLFPETYSTRDAAIARYGIVPLGIRSRYSPDAQAAKFGDRLWATNPDRCCALRKVEPNERALAGKTAWIAGLRRDQSDTRQNVLPVQWDAKFELYKICPLWNWMEAQVNEYIRTYDVPVNPLHAQGYTSIGCTHCTRANKDGGNLRGGRWAGSDKTECGLHK